MCAVGFSDCRQAAAVKVYSVVVSEVRIFSRIHSTGLEPYLALLLIYLVDRSHNPVTAGDLVFYFAGRAVVQVKVAPAIAFGSPDDISAIIEIIPISRSGLPEAARQWAIREERLRLFIDERSGFAADRLHFDDAISLMTALVVFKGECSAVLPPGGIRQTVRVRE